MTSPQSSFSNRAEQLALHLTAVVVSGRSKQSSEISAMATLVSPKHAITPHHVVANLPVDAPISLRKLSRGEPIPASKTAEDAKADLALLELAKEQSTVPDLWWEGESLPPGSTWTSFLVIPSMPDGGFATGTFDGREQIDGIEHLKLTVKDGPSNSGGVSGAPIVCLGKLVGIVARGDDRGHWYALPLDRKKVERDAGFS
jgi:hypothetical protein